MGGDFHGQHDAGFDLLDFDYTVFAVDFAAYGHGLHKAQAGRAVIDHIGKTSGFPSHGDLHFAHQHQGQIALGNRHAEWTHGFAFFWIGVDPVVIAREFGKLIDQLLRHGHGVGPVAPLFRHQALHLLQALGVDGALGYSRCSRDGRGFGFRRFGLDDGCLRCIHSGEAQNGLCAWALVKHGAHSHADLDFVSIHAYQIGVDVYAFFEFDHGQLLRRFVGELGHGGDARCGVGVQLAFAADFFPL